MTEIHFSFVTSMTSIERDEWQTLVNCDNPFVSYDYLLLLEETGATGVGTAWEPMHLTGRNPAGKLCAALPHI